MKKQQQKQFYRLSLATAISLSLAACGGGGSEPEPAPPVNSAPSIGAMSAVSIDERKSTSIAASASDADGSISSYSWSQTSGPDVELSGADTSSVTVNAPTVSADEAVVLTLTVTDDDGATATANVDISVINTHIESQISGQVLAKGTALTGADVTLTYSDISELAVTDNEGNYSIELFLPLDYSESPYSITATHGSTILSRVGLISEVVASENESQQSVQKMSLMSTSASSDDEDSSQGGTDINEVTTAESELLQSLYADETAFYESVFESLTEFALQYDHISTEKLAELASFLVYMRDNSIAAPEPFSFESLMALYESYEASDSNFDLAMDAATNTVMSSSTKPDSFSTIADATYPITILPVLESAKNTVRLGVNFDTVYQFDSVTDLTVIDNDGGDYTATWSINDDGSLTITRASTSGRYTWQSGAGNIHYGSHGTCTHRSLSEDWGMLNKRGNAPDAALITINWSVNCEDGFSEQYAYKYYVSLVTGNNTKRFRNNEVAGRALAIELPGAELSGDNFIVRVLSFSPDGSGSEIESNETFTWLIEDGVLKLSFANGDSTILYKVQENSQGVTGIVQRFTAATGETYANKGMVLHVDEGAIFTNTNDYIGSLRSGFDVSQPNQQREMGFVIHLEEGGISSQEYTDRNGNSRNGLSALTTWGITDNKLINSLKYNDWTNERCDPYSNSNCWWLQVRTWELLAKHGNRIYVREGIHRHFSRPDDNLAFPPLVDSRLNFYQID